MVKLIMDNIDLRLLGLLQAKFPLTREPFGDLGSGLGISGDEVIDHIRNLKLRKIVRQIGPIFDARKLGYQSTLVGMKIPTEMLPTAEKFIIEHPGVSHGYLRDHEFNVWITLSLPHTVDADTELQRIARFTGSSAIFSLPALKVFKLKALFGIEEEGPDVNQEGTEVEISNLREDLTQIEKQVINEIQQDLPLVVSPFAEYARNLHLEVDDLLSICRLLQDRGIMRRFGAAINHRKAGYHSNAMVCWKVTADKVDILGRKLASLSAVSHCYERKTGEIWKHNLFAMVHGHSQEDCRNIADQVAEETGLKDYWLLFSKREIKKIRVKYYL